MPDISRAGRSPSSSSASSSASAASVRLPNTAATAAATTASDVRDAGPTDAIERRREGSSATVRPASATTAAPTGPVAVKRGLAAPAKKYDASKDASTLYTAMKGGMTGWGTDEKAIHDVLRGKTPEQVKALRAAYADKYPGRDLDKELKSELSGNDLKSAMRVMTAKTPLPPAVDVQRDAKTALRTLASASPKERAALAAAHQQENGTSLAADVDKHLKGDDAIRAKALLNNDDNLAKAAQLHQAMAGMGTDEASIDEVLSSSTPAERKGIEQKYQAQYGTSLRSALNDELSGTDLQTATSLLDGDNAGVTASRLQAAMKGIGTDKAAIEKALAGTSADERAAAAAAFEQQTGRPLDAALSNELKGADLDDARTLLRDGSLSDAQRLDRAMRGLGTNEGELKAVLEGKSKAEIEALSTSYAQRTGRSLHDDVSSELGGRDRFDAQMLLRGSVDLSTDAGLKEAVARAQETRDFERKGLGNIAGAALTALGGNGRVLDESTDRLEGALAAATQADGTLSSSGADRLRTLLGYQKTDVDAYRQARDTAADAAGTGAAVVAGVAVTVATAGAAAPLVIAAGVTAGAAAKGVVGVAVRGQATEDATWSDVRTGAVDGLAGAVGGVAARGVGTVVGRTMSAGESVLAKAGVRVATEVDGVVTRGVVGRTVEKSLTGVGRGAVGGATTGAGTSVVDPNTYAKDLESGLLAVATQTSKGALAGAAAGFNPTAMAASGVVNKVAPHLQKATNATLARAGVDVQKQVERLAADGRVLQQTTAKLVTEAPTSALNGAAQSSLEALIAGRPEDIVSAAVDGALNKTQGAASGAAVSGLKETFSRGMRRPTP